MRVHRLIACVVSASLLMAGCGGDSGGGNAAPSDFDPNNRDRAAIWWGGLVRQLAEAKATGNDVRADEAMQTLHAARAPLVGQRIRFLFNVWATNPDLPETVWNYKKISSAGVWVGLLHRSDPGRIRVGVQHPGRQGARAATCDTSHQRSRSISPWYMLVWARSASPERGSITSPLELADRTVDATYRMTEYRASSSENSGSSSSVGATRTCMAFLNPASSNAAFHSSTPASK